MKFHSTNVAGVLLIEPERLADERGFFARTWCAHEFAARGLDFQPRQASLSFNQHKGTLRGLHYQAEPHAEVKLVRCVRGAVWDVAADIRPDSPTFGRHTAVELTADNRLALYIPQGVAHGFQTLADETELLYEISAFYEPQSARGCSYRDARLAIPWPLPVSQISARDATLPPLLTDEVEQSHAHAVPPKYRIIEQRMRDTR